MSQSSPIVLATLNARYAHAAFGLRYLLANLGELQPQARMMEFDINQRVVDVAEAILSAHPRIVGLGVYVWNVAPITQLVADLKRLRPDIAIIIGGPEVSHEIDQQEICRLADYVITGEADLAFADLCRQLLAGHNPPARVIAAGFPELHRLQLPYDLYAANDLAHRVVYVEASRGCPFECEFCLSSLDVPVRNVPLETFLPAMQNLLDRGLKQFKFVDRTFNLNLNISRAILEFFLERYRPGLFLHFEMIPDRLPDALREVISRFPPGSLQFEVGVQTFNPQVAALISRRQDYARLEDNLSFLRQHTGVHVHADLIVGLPGEDLASFAAGFDKLVAMDVQEIQVGMLKRLRGASIARHDDQWLMAYTPYPPYEILQTRLIRFADMQRMRRFARYWDLIANSGNFIETRQVIWQNASPFARFLQLADKLWNNLKRDHTISLATLAGEIFAFLTRDIGMDAQTVAAVIDRDYRRGGRKDPLEFLRPWLGNTASRVAVSNAQGPSRQRRWKQP